MSAPKSVVSVLVYQIDGSKLPTPATFGLPVREITNEGVFPTRIPGTGTRIEQTVDPSIYGIVASGVQVKNGRHGRKTYYTSTAVATIIADINS